MTTTTTAAEPKATDNAADKGNPGRARSVNKRTAPMTATKSTRAQQGKTKRTTTKRAPAPDNARSRPAGTFTTVDIAAQQGVDAKTLRARIRRNIDDWEPLFVDGQRHVFKDNKTTRARVDQLLA